MRRLGPLGEVGALLGLVRLVLRVGFFAFGGDVVEVDVLAILVMRGGFGRWRGQFGREWGLVVPLRRIGSLGERNFAVGVLGHVRGVARSWHLILMGVLLVCLACRGRLKQRRHVVMMRRRRWYC